MNVTKAICTFTVMHLCLSSHLYFVIEKKTLKEKVVNPVYLQSTKIHTSDNKRK